MIKKTLLSSQDSFYLKKYKIPRIENTEKMQNPKYYEELENLPN